MDCPQFESLITEAARIGSLNEQLQAAVMNHLESCDSCRRDYEQQRQLTRGLQLLANELMNTRPSPHLKSQILRELRSVHEAQANKRSWWRSPEIFFSYAAVLLVVLLAGAFLFERSEDSSQQTLTKPETEANEADTNEPSEFIPLIHGDVAAESYQLIRVQLSPESLQEFGLTIEHAEGTRAIEAEVVVAQDGLPHAIRLIGEHQSARQNRLSH